jgi:hypothetical protein
VGGYFHGERTFFCEAYGKWLWDRVLALALAIHEAQNFYPKQVPRFTIISRDGGRRNGSNCITRCRAIVRLFRFLGNHLQCAPGSDFRRSEYRVLRTLPGDGGRPKDSEIARCRPVVRFFEFLENHFKIWPWMGFLFGAREIAWQ